MRDALRFKLQGNRDDLGDWGHEYLRHLVGEVTAEWGERTEAGAATDDLMHLVRCWLRWLFWLFRWCVGYLICRLTAVVLG